MRKRQHKQPGRDKSKPVSFFPGRRNVVSNATEEVANRIVFHYENLLILDSKLKNEQFRQFPWSGGVNPAWSGNYKHLNFKHLKFRHLRMLS